MYNQLARVNLIERRIYYDKKIISLITLLICGLTFLTSCSPSDLPNDSTIIFKDAAGKDVKIPIDPQRIVDLSGNSDILFNFGYNVVGTANSDAYDQTKLPDYLKERLKNAKIVGYSMKDTADIEAIVELKPDLIIISRVQEKIYEQLGKIAPTVMIDLDDLNWKQNLSVLAKIFHKEDVLKKWLDEYESKASQKGKEIKDQNGENATYVTVLASNGQLFALDSAGIGGVLYDDMGLKKPENMPEQNSVSLPVMNFEGMAQLDPDYCIVVGSESDIENVRNNTVYKSMESVKNGNVVELPASPYFDMGYSSIGRDLFLDQVTSIMDKK